jgi:hypothetical protein
VDRSDSPHNSLGGCSTQAHVQEIPVSSGRRARAPSGTGPALLVLAAGVAGMIGTFLPWLTISFLNLANQGIPYAGQSFNGTQVGGEGWIFFALAGVSALIQLAARARGRDWRQPQAALELILGATSMFIVIRDLRDLQSLAGGIGGISLAALGIDARVGVGLWLACAAGVLICIGGLWRLQDSRRSTGY